MRTREIKRLENKVIKALAKKEKAAKVYEKLDVTVEQAVAKLGLGHMFQDDQKLVYKLDNAEGRYVTFKKYEVKRTRKPGEKQGSLSLTEAKEAGYTPA